MRRRDVDVDTTTSHRRRGGRRSPLLARHRSWQTPLTGIYSCGPPAVPLLLPLHRSEKTHNAPAPRCIPSQTTDPPSEIPTPALANTASYSGKNASMSSQNSFLSPIRRRRVYKHLTFMAASCPAARSSLKNRASQPLKNNVCTNHKQKIQN